MHLAKHNSNKIWTPTICAVQNKIHRQQQYIPCQRAFAQKSDQSLLPKRSKLSWSRSRPLSWSIYWLRGTWRSCRSAVLSSIWNLKTIQSDVCVKLSYTWMNTFLYSFWRNRCFKTICYVHISSGVTGKWWPYIRHCKKTWDNEVSVWIKTCVEQLFIVCWRHIDTCLLIICCPQLQIIEIIVWLLTDCDFETVQYWVA